MGKSQAEGSQGSESIAADKSMTVTRLTITPELAELLEADEPQTFTPPEPEPQHLVVEYHHEEGHDTRDLLATTFLTLVLASE